MKNTENLTLQQLYDKFVEKKAEISEDAIKVLSGRGESIKIIRSMFVVTLLILAALILVGWLAIEVKGLITLAVTLLIIVMFFTVWCSILYKKYCKEQKAFKADAPNIAAVQQIGFMLHDSLKDLFVPRLRYELTGIGFGVIDSLLFPLGDQIHYDPKLLELPSFQIKKSIEQLEGSCTLEFVSADLSYYGEGSDLPPYTDAPGYYLCIFFTEEIKLEITSRARYFPIEEEVS